MSSSEEIAVWKAVAEAVEIGGEGILVTIVAARGSIPGCLGAKALVGRSGIQIGNLGGGKVEAAVIKKASEMLSRKETLVLETWNLQKDVGMTCGGEVTLLFEPVGKRADWQIVVFGAGHVAQALVPLLASLPCRVDVVDPRPEWLSKIRPHVSVRTHAGGGTYLGAAPALVSETSQVVCVTQGHQTDRPIVEWVLANFPEIAFLGVIGSEVKRVALMAELREAGVADGMLERLTCPLGLPIGGNHPGEIAVSIAAQLLEQRGVGA